MTNLSSRRMLGTHAPRLVPAGETDDGPRQVSDYRHGADTVAGTAPASHRLPSWPAAVAAGPRSGAGARSGASVLSRSGSSPKCAPHSRLLVGNQRHFKELTDEIRYPSRLSHDHRPDDGRHDLPDPLNVGQGR